MEIKFVLCFLIQFIFLHSTKHAESSPTLVKPSTTEAVIGEPTFFNCSYGRNPEEIQWFHYPKAKPERQIVYGFNQIYDAYKRFRIEKISNSGALNLIIPSVTLADAGKYECQDEYGRGQKSHAEMIVLTTAPVCQSDTDLNKVVGVNNCGIQPDKLLFSCIVQYEGNERPVFNWKMVGGDKNGFVLPPTLQSDRVMYNISLSGNSLVNQSSYECSSSRGSSPKSSCRLGNMTIISKSVSCTPTECVCQDSSSAVIALVILFVIIPIVVGVTASLVYYFLVYRPQSKLKYNTLDGKKYIEAVFFITLLLLPFYVGMLAILGRYLIAHLQKRRQKKSTEEKTSSANEKPPIPEERMLIINEEAPRRGDAEGEDDVKKSASEEPQDSNRTTNARDVKKEGPDNDQLRDRKDPSVDKLTKEIHDWKEKYGTSIAKGSELDKAIEQLHSDKAKLNKKILRIQSEHSGKIQEIQSEHSSIIKKIQSEKDGLDIEIQNLKLENETLKSQVKELEQRLFQADYSEKSVLVHKITTKANESEKKAAITGIAVLEKSLFISHENTTEIEVYDSATYMHVRQLPVPEKTGIIGIYDMASCVKLKCLILIGQFKESKDCSVIGQIDAEGETLNQWPSGGNSGRLSVYESNVIVCLSDKLEIREFNEKGELINTVRLSPAEGLFHPWHAIKVTSNHFIVSHGDKDDKLRRVCVVDLEGKILKECKEWGKSSFEVPFCLLEDNMKSILVADSKNQRIILLNSSLKWQRNLLETSEKDHLPTRLSFDETGNRLFVAVNKKVSSKELERGQVLKGGQVLIYNVKKQ